MQAVSKEVLTVRVEVSHTFPVSVGLAFGYITALKNWPEYWPKFIRFEDPAGARFAKPGDRVTPFQSGWRRLRIPGGRPVRT